MKDMIGSSLKKKKYVSEYHNKTKVTIDGFAMARNNRVNICVRCAKTSGCNHRNRKRICTSAGHWSDIKKKYKWKIMGRYRLTLWVRKHDTSLR
jgi:hypothetical protein